MPAPVFYSVSMYGTASIEIGAGTIVIADGVATLSVEQTSNIGVGVAIEYNSLECYIAPNRLGFDSGGTAELLVDTKIAGATSGATGIVRFVELTSGTWAGGDAAGWIYFEKTTGTFENNEQINRTKPTSSSNIATVDGTIEGNIGNGNTEFVVKTATGGTPANQSSTAVTSIHHVWATIAAFEGAFTGSSYINNTSLVTADVVAHCCMYYDHDNQTPDSTAVVVNWGGTTDATRKLVILIPTGTAESINNQRHSGVWDSNKAYMQLAESARFIECQEGFSDIQGIQLDAVNTISAIIDIDPKLDDGTYNIDSVIGKNANGQYQAYVCATDLKAYIVNIWNCIFDGNSGSSGKGVICNKAAPVFNMFHNTIYGVVSNQGIETSNSPAFTVINNAVFNNSDDFVGAGMTISYCASDDGDGTNEVDWDAGATDWALVFADHANGDFSLNDYTGASAVIEQGTDLSSSEGIWRDIAGNERGSTPDIGAFEFVSSGSAITKIFAESAGATDSVIRAIIINKIYAEAMSASDSVPHKLSITKILNDTAQAIDGWLKTTGISKVWNESATGTDSESKFMGLVKVFSETANAAESFARTLGLVKVKNEITNAIENLIKKLIIKKIKNESVSSADEDIKRLAINKIKGENVTSTDTSFKFLGLVKVFSEVASASESFAHVLGLVKVKNEAATATETRHKGLIIKKIIAESVIAIENYAKKLAINKVKTEEVNASDSSLFFLGLVKIRAEIAGAVEDLIKYIRLVTGWCETIEHNSEMTVVVEHNSKFK